VNPGKLSGRNHEWKHLKNQDIIAMPEQMGISLVCRMGLSISEHPWPWLIPSLPNISYC